MKALFTEEAETRGIVVRVSVSYLPEQSEPQRGRWFWAYHIRIENEGDQAVQLLTRHWIITDANNKTHEVQGLGVVGHQPLLKPGEAFEYTSGSSLETPHGTMQGTYFCVAEDGHKFDALIPEFVLSLPRTLH